MSVLAGEAGGAPDASQSHATIILTLLLLFGGVLLVGAVLAIAICRYLRIQRVRGFGDLKKRSRTEFRFIRTPSSAIFHGPNRWLAVRSNNQRSVQAAVGLHNPTRCSWTEGMARVTDQKLFISPTVHGWTLVFGALLPDPGDDVDACFRFLQRLSRELGEVQFFSVNRAVGHHGWAWFDAGRALRGYVWAGETLWNQGQKTQAERKLGLKCYDYCEGDAANAFAQSDHTRANTERLPLLAAIWSVDPASVDDSALTGAYGIAGDLSQARR